MSVSARRTTGPAGGVISSRWVALVCCLAIPFVVDCSATEGGGAAHGQVGRDAGRDGGAADAGPERDGAGDLARGGDHDGDRDAQAHADPASTPDGDGLTDGDAAGSDSDDGALDDTGDGDDASVDPCEGLPSFGEPTRFSLPPGFSAGAFRWGPAQYSTYTWSCADGGDNPIYGLLNLHGDEHAELVVYDDCEDVAVGDTSWLVFANPGDGFASTPLSFALPPGYSPGAFRRGPAQYATYTWTCADGNDHPIYGTMDVDGDRLGDLVVYDDCEDAAVGDTNWLVYRNDGSGFEAEPLRFELPAGYSEAAFDKGPALLSTYTWTCAEENNYPVYGTLDVDGDGRPDLVVFDHCQDDTVGTSVWLVYRNTGAGFEAEPLRFELPPGYSAAAFDRGPALYSTYTWSCADGNNYPVYGTMDVDGDSRPDLVVFDHCEIASVGTSEWLVYLNSGEGFDLTPRSLQLPEGYSQAAFDFGPAQYSRYTWLCAGDNNNPIYAAMDLAGTRTLDLIVYDHCDDPSIGSTDWLAYTATCD